MYQNAWRKRKVQIMVDGGFEHCARGQAECCQIHGNPTTSLLPSNSLSFAKTCIAVAASRRGDPVSTKNSTCGRQETIAYTEAPSERHANVLHMFLRTIIGCNSLGVSHGSSLHARKVPQRDVALLNKRSRKRSPPYGCANWCCRRGKPVIIKRGVKPRINEAELMG